MCASTLLKQLTHSCWIGGSFCFELIDTKVNLDLAYTHHRYWPWRTFVIFNSISVTIFIYFRGPLERTCDNETWRRHNVLWHQWNMHATPKFIKTRIMSTVICLIKSTIAHHQEVYSKWFPKLAFLHFNWVDIRSVQSKPIGQNFQWCKSWSLA